MASSYRRAYQDRYPLAAIVFGDKPAPPELVALFDYAIHVASDDAPDDSATGYFLAYSGLKAQLRNLFPGYQTYCWIDADCWFQGNESMHRILAGVASYDICIHPEFDIHYANYPTPSQRTLQIYRTNYGEQLDAMPLNMPMVNSGVFAMRANARTWDLWASELQHLRDRHKQGHSVFFSDQIALHKLIHAHQLRIHPLRAIDNWQTYACLPLVHRATRSLRVPTPPHEHIGLMHLAGATKDMVVIIDGQQTTLRYRDLMRLFGS
jgi:hypothetical protein